MRVSTDDRDPGYLSNACDWYVKFNYQFIHDVVAADDVEGTVTIITDELSPYGEDYLERELHGAVTLYNPFEVPDNVSFVSLPGSRSSSTKEYEFTRQLFP